MANRFFKPDTRGKFNFGKHQFYEGGDSGQVCTVTLFDGVMIHDSLDKCIEYFRRTHELNIATNNGRVSPRAEERYHMWDKLREWKKYKLESET